MKAIASNKNLLSILNVKTLIIIRHAKSEWGDISKPDFERTLSDRGKSDAPLMAKRLREKISNIDLFISSPAKRARKTAIAFLKEYGKEKSGLQLVSALYEAPVIEFYDVIENLDDEFNSVAVFAHNPGITGFVNSLECFPVYNMPTTGVFALKIKSDKWKHLENAEKEFLFFDFPKNND